MEGGESKVTIYLKGGKINLDKNQKQKSICIVWCALHYFFPAGGYFRRFQELLCHQKLSSGLERKQEQKMILLCWPGQGEQAPYTTGGMSSISTENLSFFQSDNSGHILWRKSRVEFPNHMSCNGRGKEVVSAERTSWNSAKRSTNQSDSYDLYLLGKLLLLTWWERGDQVLTNCQTQGKAGWACLPFINIPRL